MLRHVFLFTVMFFSWGYSNAYARDALPEYIIKAGYLYNFSLLTAWPSESLGDAFDICLYRNQEFKGALETIQGKLVENRPIVINYLEHPKETHACNILFVAEIKREEMNRIVEEINKRPVLIVTDDEALVKAGAAIFLRPEGRRLVFEIDLSVAKSAQLEISARLLRLAR
jgi:hypothetical protein